MDILQEAIEEMKQKIVGVLIERGMTIEEIERDYEWVIEKEEPIGRAVFDINVSLQERELP